MSRLGELIVYVGAMAVGKSQQLCNNYKADVEKGLSVLAIKPTIANRGEGKYTIKSRSGVSIPCLPFNSIGDLTSEDLKGIDKLYIDEVQFYEDFDDVERILDLNLDGIDVEAYGLDMDAFGQEFGYMGLLLARADVVYKIRSNCHKCSSNDARFTAKVDNVYEGDIVDVAGEYVSLCKSCYVDHMEDSTNELINNFSNYNGSYENSNMRSYKGLPNAFDMGGGLFLIKLGNEGEELHCDLLVHESLLQGIGWTVEEVADIIFVDTLERLFEEMGAYDG